eukprot:743225-Prymnesium_polylepis.1
MTGSEIRKPKTSVSANWLATPPMRSLTPSLVICQWRRRARRVSRGGGGDNSVSAATARKTV